VVPVTSQSKLFLMVFGEPLSCINAKSYFIYVLLFLYLYINLLKDKGFIYANLYVNI
jgi:hypothetical protein